MSLDPNPGDRPSRLQLDRYLTGELEGEEHASVHAWVQTHPEGRAHLDAVEQAKARVAPFDATALRSRTLDGGPANNNRFFAVLGLVAAVALVLLAALAALPTDLLEQPDILLRGGAELQLFLPSGEAYDGRPLGDGDTVGLRVTPAGHTGVVVMSVDGTRSWTVFYPGDNGVKPQPVGPDGRLPEAIVLDAAPGPEVFVAVFDLPVPMAWRVVEPAWDSGGLEGLEQLAEERDDVDVVVVQRR